MIHEEVNTVYMALGTLAGNIPEEQWELVRLCRRNLQAIMLSAQHMEDGLCVAETTPEPLEVPQ